ncbi:MAG: RidA family protein [Bryobacterales bacterium]|nr:RidA family protein [Bryobacterales bacterium]
MLINNPKGNYAFIKGIAPYSGGVVAASGHEIVHARFLQPAPLKTGFDRVRAHLEAERRPVESLCGMELRSPKPFTFQGFSDFNAGYVGVLRDWGVFLDGVNPIARTNIAPEVGAPAEPSLYGFSYTVPSTLSRKTFVVAGGGELPEGSLDPHDVVRRGETSLDALREKARFVMGLMAGRIKELGVSWDEATVTEIYTVFNITPFLATEILKPMGKGSIHGVVWHYSRPPIVSIEYEMDLRGVARETVI